jgi:hypothetical protein
MYFSYIAPFPILHFYAFDPKTCTREREGLYVNVVLQSHLQILDLAEPFSARGELKTSGVA